VTRAEQDRRELDVDRREAVLDAREAVLDALQHSLGRLDTGHAAARAEASQARLQAQRLRSRSQQAREASRQHRGAPTGAARPPWQGDYPLGAEFAALSDRIMSSTEPHQVIGHVEDAAVRLVPGATLASVMVLGSGGRFHTPAGTDPIAVRLGDAQDHTGEGPCHDATRPGSPKLARCDDLTAADAPWPRFGPAAAALGVRSVVAVGLLPLSPARLGALHLYGRDPGALTDTDVDVAAALASHLAVALLALTQLDQTHQQLAHLRDALDTRDVIGQAKGIVMTQHQITADEAFALLSAASQHRNTKLRDLAEQVVHDRRL
jgi:GAF domain-containing protein